MPRFGNYELCYLAQGLKSSPSVFQSEMNRVQGGSLFVNSLLYVDDLLVVANNFWEMSRNIRDVLSKITHAGLKLAPKKCHFFVRRIKFLGHEC